MYKTYNDLSLMIDDLKLIGYKHFNLSDQYGNVHLGFNQKAAEHEEHLETIRNYLSSPATAAGTFHITFKARISDKGGKVSYIKEIGAPMLQVNDGKKFKDEPQNMNTELLIKLATQEVEIKYLTKEVERLQSEIDRLQSELSDSEQFELSEPAESSTTMNKLIETFSPMLADFGSLIAKHFNNKFEQASAHNHFISEQPPQLINNPVNQQVKNKPKQIVRGTQEYYDYIKMQIAAGTLEEGHPGKSALENEISYMADNYPQLFDQLNNEFNEGSESNPNELPDN
jgi:hypothetical protein